MPDPKSRDYSRVYLFHTHHDAVLADAVRDFLVCRGGYVLPEVPALPDSVRAAVWASETIVLIVSQAALESEIFQLLSELILQEAGRAGKLVIPLLVGATEVLRATRESLRWHDWVEVPNDPHDVIPILDQVFGKWPEVITPGAPPPDLPAAGWKECEEYKKAPRAAEVFEEENSGVCYPHRAPSARVPNLITRLLGLLGGLLAYLPVETWQLVKNLGLAKPKCMLPQDTRIDNVHFTVTAPATFAVGEHAELIVWAHLAAQQKLVLRKAMAALGIYALHKLLFRSVGPVQIERGTVLSVILEIEDLIVANPHNLITWTGTIGNTNFVIEVPKNTPEGTKRATCFIRVNGLEIARVDFVVRVAISKGKQNYLETKVVHYRSAFASYAGEDREGVLARIQGMQKSTQNLKVFVDVLRFRSGDEWEGRLFWEIKKADVFYLFWCRHASKSEWVEKEWRYAYSSKGLWFIDPVPLESPDIAPPPEELKSRHFYDSILAFVKHAE